MSLGFTPMVTQHSRETRGLHHLYTRHQMEFILRRERGRADRHQHQFSLVVFHVARDLTRASPMMRLARIILDHAAVANLVMIREAVRDASVRYRVTVAQERFSRAIRWLRAERLNFPTRETISTRFDEFDREIVPMWGRTPFNNYLFVFRRA